MRGGIKPFYKVVDPEFFNACFEEFIETDQGKGTDDNLLFSHEEGHPDRRITGFKFSLQTKKIDLYYKQGPAYL